MAALLILAGTLLFGLLAGAGLSWLLVRRHIARAVLALQAQMLELRKEMNGATQPQQPLAPSAPPVNGFNLNRRPEAVRRLKRAQAPEDIALGTGWTVAEIALLKKIEEIVSV